MKFSRAQAHGTARGFQNSRICKLAIMALVILLICLPGTRAQKTALLKKMTDKAHAKLDRVYARYLKWRQRKCWMWGGGFMCGALGVLPNVFVAAGDERSFDALIPD